MNYKLIYIGKTKHFDAFVYDVDGFYTYVIIDYNGEADGPHGPYENLEAISNRMKLENPGEVDEEKKNLAERKLQQGLEYIRNYVNYYQKQNMQKFNI